MRICVTGGAGFLGYHLCLRLLREGHDVLLFDDLSTGTTENLSALRCFCSAYVDRLVYVPMDIRGPFSGYRTSPREKPERLYHLACPASPVHYQQDPVRTIETAVIGTRNALEAAWYWKCPIVITSTSEVYGDPLEHPQTETYWGNVNPFGHRAMYDEGKRAGEAMAWAYMMEHGVDVRIARLFNTYGPQMRFDDGRVVSNFILQALRGEPLTIYGDGRQTRSFCYVDDTVEALVRLMEFPRHAIQTPAHPIVNIGNPEECTMRDLAAEVMCGVKGILRMPGDGNAVGAPYALSVPLPKDDPTRRRPDITRARQWLGWEPKVSLADGIAWTIADFRQRLESEPHRDEEAAS